MEIGTSLTNGTGRRMPGLNDIVAVPLYVDVIPFFVGPPVILKSVIVCICGEVPLNITILNVALKAGELELIFLNSHAPDSIHRTLSSGRLELPYCRLAIAPNLEPDIYGCCACVIDIMLEDVIVTTTAAITIVIGSLVINVCLLLGVTKKY